MDDLQIFIYILFGVIYIILQIMKSKRKREKEMGKTDQQEAYHREEPKLESRNMRFEDWMGQLEEEKEDEALDTISHEEVKPSFIMEERERADRRRHEPEIKKEVEKVKVMEPSFKPKRRKALVFEPLTSIVGREQESNVFLEKIRNNPDWARDAVVMSEIINRKYQD